MAVLNFSFALAILFLFLNVLFANDAWARVPTSPSEVFLHGVSQGHTLAKRASKYTYDYCVAAGNRLLCATQMSDTEATTFLGHGSVVAQYTTTNQLIADGWQREPGDDGLAGLFDEYLGPSTLSSLGISLDESEVVNWVHQIESEQAWYQCWYNAQAGAIIVDSTYGPAYIKQDLLSKGQWPSDGVLPEIQQLSDVMWIEWANQASVNGVEPSNIQYIFRMNIVNVDTRNVILNVLPPPDTADEGYWDFETSSEAGQALLGTPNGNAQSWFLINHKDALGADQTDEDNITGLKTISKVRVWKNSGTSCYILATNEDVPCLHMLFFITTYTAT